jgi:uncharacterized protein (DUF1501 family)
VTLTRRRLIQAAGGAVAAHTLLPAVARVGEAFGQTAAHPDAAQRNRLVVVHLYGGNDGLNTVIPTSGRAHDVYRKVRPATAYRPSQTLPLDRYGDRAHHLGLNALLPTVHRLYRAGRVAIVQGVDYPNHNYSHFVSTDIWHSGEPGSTPESGWLGRHLDRCPPKAGELRGVGIGYELPLMLRGRERSGTEIASVAATRFGDGTGLVADARHDALARQATDLVDVLSRVPAVPATGSQLADGLLSARSLLGLDLGVECVFVGAGGFDTHVGQRATHEALLRDLDASLAAFFYGSIHGKRLGIGTLPAALAARTVVVVLSEFGRRIGENGTGAAAGTDHGAAGPVLVIGPADRIGAGLHGEHPPLGTTRLPADNLAMTTDMRSVYQTLLTDWLYDPDPLYQRIRPIDGLLR